MENALIRDWQSLGLGCRMIRRHRAYSRHTGAKVIAGSAMVGVLLAGALARTRDGAEPRFTPGETVVEKTADTQNGRIVGD